MEKSPETKRPRPSRESVDRPADKIRPEPREVHIPKSRKHISDTTLGYSWYFSASIYLVQKFIAIPLYWNSLHTHESYTDSSNVDYSTSSVETVIVRNGVPTTIQKSLWRSMIDLRVPRRKLWNIKGCNQKTPSRLTNVLRAPVNWQLFLHRPNQGFNVGWFVCLRKTPRRSLPIRNHRQTFSRRPTDERASHSNVASRLMKIARR